MTLRPILFCAVLGGSLPCAAGYVYVSDFGSASEGDILPGVDGWSQSIANFDDQYPLSWMSTHNSELAATVGTYYDNETPGSSYYVYRSIGVPLAGSILGMTFGIQDSTDDPNFGLNRNNFWVSAVNGSGDNLFTLYFTATNQVDDWDDPNHPDDPLTSNTQWDMKWNSIGGNSTAEYPPVGEFRGAMEDGSYNMFITFTGDGSDVKFGLFIDAPATESDFLDSESVLTGLNGETIAELRVGSDLGDGTDWGDNFFAFRGIPEPGAVALLGLSSLGLLARRRR
jgi:hypothetical protein